MAKKKLQLKDVLTPNEHVVAMIPFKSWVIVATNLNIYKMINGILEPVELVYPEKEQEDASTEV